MEGSDRNGGWAVSGSVVKQAFDLFFMSLHKCNSYACLFTDYVIDTQYSSENHSVNQSAYLL